jgi:glycogen operon protein
MSEQDWHNPGLHTLGMFLAGDALRETDADGNRLTDHSFLLVVNAAAEPLTVRVPDPSWAPSYEVVLDTSDGGWTQIDAGAELVLPPRCVGLLRAL